MKIIYFFIKLKGEHVFIHYFSLKFDVDMFFTANPGNELSALHT